MSYQKLAALGGEPQYPVLQELIRPSMPPIKEIQSQLERIHQSTFITNGHYNREFEEIIRQELQVPFALTVSNATIGLMLALRALADHPRGEVILPSFTFASTGLSVIWNGLTPVFADIDPATKNLDPWKVEEKITSNTVAIMPVYIFSNVPMIEEFDRIGRRYHLPVIYDTAQGLGSRYRDEAAGRFGTMEVFSLAPTKVATSVEGCIITLSDPELARRLEALRNIGKTGEYDYELTGLNARMTEYQAVVGMYNFRKLQSYIHYRQDLIDYYRSRLVDVPGLGFQQISPNSKSGNNYMVVFVDESRFGLSRNQVAELFRRENIQTKRYFYPALHRMPPFQAYADSYLEVSEEAAETGLALPLYNQMETSLAENVCRLWHAIYENRHTLRAQLTQSGEGGS
ncbi:MAG: DegT/DnrJ/EryC1/StrS family aminotransferase [Candidatus Delongbacteria bacterium]|nr:DegT/DnrJ/EryC1/StrS family aminotransferase [Candidatus Delongbacteria bacterium]